MFLEITDRKKWNDLVDNNLQTDILQYWQWGDAKSIDGWQPFRFVACSNENLTGDYVAGQILMKKIKFFGNLAYISHGPFFNLDANNKNLWQEFENGIVNWAKKNNVFSIEIEPKWDKIPQIFSDNNLLKNWIYTHRNRQPLHKLLINLDQSEDEIFAAMQKSTRYNIKYAQKKGVIVNKYKPDDILIDEKIDLFYNLLLETQVRSNGYPIRSKNFFKQFVKGFSGTDNIVLFEAVFEGDVVAMNISEFTKVWASSFYAASNRLHPKVKAPYPMRWEAILEAKNRGCKIYDFWAITPGSNFHKGVSDHKISFGGKQLDLMGIFVYKLNWKSNLWEIALKLMGLIQKFKYR